MFPSDVAACDAPVRYTLLAALCWVRQAEITDALVGLLVDLVHRINARAARRVEKELLGDLSSVLGKKGIFLKMCTAALNRPDDVVRDAVWTAVPGGERTLRKLVKELMAGSREVRERSPLPAAGLLHPLLPADARPGAGRAAVPGQQHRLPADDECHRPTGQLPLGGRQITFARSDDGLVWSLGGHNHGCALGR